MQKPASQQLAEAIAGETLEGGEFVVKLLKLTNEGYPGREAHGVLPLVVVGHRGVSEHDWAGWLREHATAAYGTAYAMKLVETGVDIKDMLPTAPLGRLLRISKAEPWRSLARHYRAMNEAGAILGLVEQWPSLYNLMVQEMSGEEMTLSEFVSRVRSMPTPWEVGQGRYQTLGDLIGRGVVLTPNW